MSSATSNSGMILLDDGEYFIELNQNYPADRAPGFLQRRCPVGPTRPGGFDCLGSFHRNTGGDWQASINKPYDDYTGDSCYVGEPGKRIDAIVTLWRVRHQATFTGR